MDSSLSKALAATIRQSFAGNNRWHGSLLDLVENLSAEQALWRPGPERHCIWEIVRHMTFWRRYLLERVAGRPTPDWKKNNWTLPHRRDEQAWLADLEELKHVQSKLVEWFDARDPQILLEADETGNFPQFMLEAGIIGHDSYHVGQIAILRALMGLSPPQGA